MGRLQHQTRHMRSFRAALRRRRQQEDGRWFVVVSALTDVQITAVGVFTAANPRAFYSKRAIRSLKGKLLALRDRHLPGKRIENVNLMVSGETNAVILNVDRIIDDFKARALFKKERLYQFLIETSPTAPVTAAAMSLVA